MYCQDRNLTDIPYGIPRETKRLLLQDNHITNGPRLDEEIFQLTKLVNLDVHSNLLTAFPSRLPLSIKELTFRNNEIKFIGRKPLQGLTLLTDLFLDGNSLTNQGISEYAFQDTISLTQLDLSNNELTFVPEGLPQSLHFLYLKNNNIDRVTKSSLERLINLKILRLSFNAINVVRIDPGSFLPLAALSELDLSNNQLDEIPTDLPEQVYY